MLYVCFFLTFYRRKEEEGRILTIIIYKQKMWHFDLFILQRIAYDIRAILQKFHADLLEKIKNAY